MLISFDERTREKLVHKYRAAAKKHKRHKKGQFECKALACDFFVMLVPFRGYFSCIVGIIRLTLTAPPNTMARFDSPPLPSRWNRAFGKGAQHGCAMVHGGSRSFHLPGRRWPAIVPAIVLSLIMARGESARDMAPLADPHRRQTTHAKATLRPSPSSQPSLTVNSTSPTIPGELMVDAWPTFVKPSSFSADSLATPVRPSVMTVYVTAYCACKRCCGSHAKGITASGRPTTYNGGHFVAADTSILPYGSKIIVPGYNDGKAVEVIDRGGAIKGAHIDIFMPTHAEAVEWGKKQLEITIVQ